ncbi:hypothetical protein PWP89_12065 [Stenotrophomonas rhizophila]|uniref:hypothetical protein n=1 Tax=Stenotrophomonas rhizophila TaxID=216778 RepID=UPI000B83104E|nr:hypothetical protein [Stenotrophomonas rhizophila]
MSALRWMIVMVLLNLPVAQALAGGDGVRATPAIPEQCLKTVRDYVKRTRGWDATVYAIDAEDVGGSGRGFSVRLLAEMSAQRLAGGAESFHVDTDPACSRVTGELGYQ